jgi:predicted alpha/beta superfamily hydrolase
MIGLITEANAQSGKDDFITIGRKVSINSSILNEKRTLYVYLPVGYDNFGNKKYPVAYLLDGGWNFEGFIGIVHHLSEALGNKLLPRMIVIGILNTDRTRDLTPTSSEFGLDGKIVGIKTGGGEKFTSFIKNELFPYIDSSYHTSGFKILIGHSLGGLIVINTLVHNTDMFDAYVAIDPSMWWDNKKLLIQANEVMKQKKFEGKSLFLGIANTMPVGMDTLHVQKDTSALTTHIRSIFQLRDLLQKYPQNGLTWRYKYYNDDSHGSVPLIAEYDAMRFIFSLYKFPDSR